MCGIAGAIHVNTLDREAVLQSLRHRGPDDSGVFQDGPATLLHTRLAIQDIDHGRQPMQLGPLTLVYNGELYNHRELRDQLPGPFHTHCDTETLLHLFARYREQCLPMLDGMFAFAVWDRESQELFLARDRVGQKPLYLYHHDRAVVFASELNALRAAVPLEVNNSAISHYLRLGCFYRSHTPYRHVSELLPGSWVRIAAESPVVSPRQWWTIRDAYARRQSSRLSTRHGDDPGLTRSVSGCRDRAGELLTGAVESQLANSDLEVGVLLSGGIDSSLLATLAAKARPGLPSFTVRFEGGYDEAPQARQLAERLGTRHTDIPIRYDTLQDDIETILGAYGEPFWDSSAIPSWYICREARRQVTVVLNGDGADELFGGYRRYVPFAHADWFATPSWLRGGLRGLCRLLPIPSEKMSRWNYLYRLLALAGQESPANYLAATTDVFEGLEMSPMQQNDPVIDELAHDLHQWRSVASSPLDVVMGLDAEAFLAGDLLVKMDIASMAHGLEARSPFLARAFLEEVPALPPACKVCGLRTKVILRSLAETMVPVPGCADRPKRGFEVPLKQWVDRDLKEIIFDSLTHPRYADQLVDQSLIGRLLENRLTIPPEKRAKTLWALFALELWYRRCVTG